MEIPDSPKLPEKLYCVKCDYIAYHKGDFNKHIRTRKHSWNCFGTVLELPGEKVPNNIFQNSYDCTCGKKYKTSSGLWKHKKLCVSPETNKLINIDSVEPNQVISNAIIELIKQNNDLRNLILEQNSHRYELTIEKTKQNTEITTQVISDVSKHITTEIINAVKMGNLGVVNNTMTNSHNNNNNSFNLNVFLNETCKDAMNIDEFIQKIQISNEDLEETARLGYSSGISRIFIKELNLLDITQKPIHCSDAKRETVYIKDNNKWEKDDDDKSKLILAVKKTAQKNLIQLFEWEKTHPMCKKDPDSVSGRLYNKIILNSMSGGTIEEQLQNINKVVKNIIKNTIIDKQMLVMV